MHDRYSPQFSVLKDFVGFLGAVIGLCATMAGGCGVTTNLIKPNTLSMMMEYVLDEAGKNVEQFSAFRLFSSKLAVPYVDFQRP